jgi:hypothetical protein
MSKLISENQDAWGKVSWINDLTTDKVLQANLTDDYAHDVLEAVAEGYFPTLDSAIAELSLRTGLTASEAGVIKTAATALVKANTEVVIKKEEETVPGNKEDVAGERLVKEGPAEASAKADVKVAGELPQGLKDYMDKKKGGNSEDKGEDKKEEMPKEECSIEDKKEADAEASASVDKTAENKKAWFQGNEEPTKEGEVTANDPEKLGYPKEMSYPNKPMETTAPGGENSTPYEVKKYTEEAKVTKEVMGPKGTEFETKVKMQRIPEGEKPANASSKRMGLIAAIVKADSKKKV